MATEIFLLSHLDAVITYTIRYDKIRKKSLTWTQKPSNQLKI